MKNGLRFTIVMAEDDEDDRIIIDEAFKEIGYEAEIKKFITGEGLLHYLKQIEPDLYPSLIILDNTLPNLDIAQMIDYLKHSEEYRQIPIIVYTTSISPRRKEELMQLGAYRCIEKKSAMKELVEVASEFKNIAENNAHS